MLATHEIYEICHVDSSTERDTRTTRERRQRRQRQQTKRKARRARQGQAGTETNAQADGQKGRPTDRHNDGGGHDHKIALRDLVLGDVRLRVAWS